MPYYSAHQALYNAAKMSQIYVITLMLLYVEVFSTAIPAKWGVRCSLHPNRTSLFILLHNSMRHRPFFDIIESMSRLTTRLQIKPLLIYFRGWVQKLFNCKGLKVIWVVASAAAAPLSLFYLLTEGISLFWFSTRLEAIFFYSLHFSSSFYILFLYILFACSVCCFFFFFWMILRLM